MSIDPGMVGQAVADGLLTGAVISLGAIGISFTMQIMRFANFSHAELLTWGGYLALVVVGFIGAGLPTAGLSFGLGLVASALLAMLLTGALAWGVDRLVFQRLRRSGAHHLTLVNAQAGVAGYLMGTDPEKAATALHDISEHTRKALDELRATVGLLRQADDPEGDPTHPAPGRERLGELVGPEIAVRVEGTPRALVPAMDVAAYRIVQEALTNARKHASGAVAAVELQWSGRELRIRVENGPGHERHREHGGGHGLIGMRERARACGGELTTHRRVDGGFVVQAILPLEKDNP